MDVPLWASSPGLASVCTTAAETRMRPLLVGGKLAAFSTQEQHQQQQLQMGSASDAALRPPVASEDEEYILVLDQGRDSELVVLGLLNGDSASRPPTSAGLPSTGHSGTHPDIGWFPDLADAGFQGEQNDGYDDEEADQDATPLAPSGPFVVDFAALIDIALKKHYASASSVAPHGGAVLKGRPVGRGRRHRGGTGPLRPAPAAAAGDGYTADHRPGLIKEQLINDPPATVGGATTPNDGMLSLPRTMGCLSEVETGETDELSDDNDFVIV